MKGFMVCCVVLCWVAPILPCYVSTVGTDSDSCGTSTNNTCATISGCMNTLNATILNILPGNYTGQGICNLTFMGSVSVVAPFGGVCITCDKSNVFTYNAKSMDTRFKVQGITFYFSRNHFKTNATLNGCINVAQSNFTSTITIENCTFIGFYSEQSGVAGAVSNCYPTNDTVSPRLFINSSIFINNHGLTGGAVCLSGIYSFINNSVFINNTGNQGGGVYLYNGANSIWNSKFIGNSAKLGGAIYTSNHGTVVGSGGKNLEIIGNRAVDGGGIAIGNIKSMTMLFSLHNSIITNNEAFGNGGGVSVFGYQVTISNTKIMGNTAGFGGGMWFGAAPNSASLDFPATIVFNNTASNYGGGLYVAKAAFGNGEFATGWNVVGLTVTGNSAIQRFQSEFRVTPLFGSSVL